MCFWHRESVFDMGIGLTYWQTALCSLFILHVFMQITWDFLCYSCDSTWQLTGEHGTVSAQVRKQLARLHSLKYTHAHTGYAIYPDRESLHWGRQRPHIEQVKTVQNEVEYLNVILLRKGRPVSVAIPLWSRHFTKLCKLVYPWESVSKIQSIKERKTW